MLYNRDARLRSEHEYGGFWRRAGAFLVDSFVYGMIISFAFPLLGSPARLVGATLVYDLRELLWAGLAVYAYFFLTTALWARTPGKWLFGLVVVDSDGQRPGLGRVLLREVVGRFLSGFLFLGYLWVAWDEEKQGWHDKLAGTYVERAGRAAARQPRDERPHE